MRRKACLKTIPTLAVIITLAASLALSGCVSPVETPGDPPPSPPSPPTHPHEAPEAPPEEPDDYVPPPRPDVQETPLPQSLSWDKWQPTSGPPGASVSCLAVDPTAPNIVYAGLQDGGMCRSTNGGETWDSVLFRTDSYIADIIATTEVVYAAAGSIGLRRSWDRGLSWEEVEVADEVRVHGISLPPHGGVLLAHSEDERVFLSRDGGDSWRNVSGDLPQHGISAMTASGADELWVGQSNGMNGGLYHTTDGGRHWEKATLPQPPDTDVFSLLADNDDPDTIYVSVGNVHNQGRPEGQYYLFATHDGGSTWREIDEPTHSGFVWFLDHSPDGSIYLSTAMRVWRSWDRGVSWEAVDFEALLGDVGTGDIHDMAIDPTDPDTLYIPLLNGVGRSSNGGRTWSLTNEGFVFTKINLLDTAPYHTGTVYAATTGGEGTYRSTDYGESWDWLNRGGIGHPWADELLADPLEAGKVYETADVGITYRTTDGGEHWGEVWEEFRQSSIDAMAVSPSHPHIIYAVKNGFGIFKSDNRGEDWDFLHQSGVDYTYTIAIHPQDPDIVFSGYNPKPFQDWAMVRRSLDGGESWETVLEVPHSKGITSVAIDPNNPNTVYAGSIGEEGGSVFKSTDGGTNWSMLNQGFTMCTVWGQPQLIARPDDPDTAYCGTWLGGTWKTTDDGARWTLLEGAPVSATALSMNPDDYNTVYLADRASPTIWRTSDGGETWEEIANFRRDGAFLVNRVLSDGDTLYAATFGPGIHGGKLYKSSDGGEGWTDITGTLPRSVLDVALDPTNPDIIYVTTHVFGAYRSADGGETWEEMTGFPNIGGYDIEVDPVNPEVLYACGLGGCTVPDWCMVPHGYTFSDDSGVYKSTDSGSTWSQVLATGNECRAVRIHPQDHEMIFATAMDDGLQVSTDGGESWASYNLGLVTTVLTSCAVAGESIYAGSQACGVASGDLNTATGAVSWRPERSGGPVPPVYSLDIRVDPENPQRIFVGSNPGGLYRSDDGGATFYDKNFLTPSVVVDDPLRQGYYTFTLNPADPQEVWLGTWGKGIYKSYDGMDFDITAFGQGREMYGKYIYNIAVDPHPPHSVYVASEEGVFRSDDGGITWEDISHGLHTTQIRTLAISANGELYAGSKGYGVYRYEGDYWEQLTALGNFGTFWPIWDNRPLYQYSSLLIHPDDNRIIYMGTFPAGVYKSTDGGKSWREMNVGWTNDGVFCLVFHPEDTDIIYAGTYNGINRTVDGGEHWEMRDQGWPTEQWVFSIAFDPENPDVMYACSKNGENMGSGSGDFHGTVMKSTDGGLNWAAITNGLDTNQEFYNIIADPILPQTLYLASQNDGVFISHNGGGRWTPWNEGLENTMAGTNGNNVTSVLALSADNKVIYFGTSGSGVWRRGIER